MNLREDLIDTLTEAPVPIFNSHDGRLTFLPHLDNRQALSQITVDALVEWLYERAEDFEGPNLAPRDVVRVVADVLRAK